MAGEFAERAVIDGVKVAGMEESQVKVADIAMHLLDAIEAGERKLASPDAPLATSPANSVATNRLSESAATKLAERPDDQVT